MRSKLLIGLALGIVLCILYASVTFFVNLSHGELVVAARKGDLHAVKKLVSQGRPVDGRDIHFMTPLMASAAGGHIDVMRFLIAQGADVNAHNNSSSVLMFAVSSGNTNAVRLLLQKNADVNWQSDIGDTALNTAHYFKNSKLIIQMLKDS